MLNANGDDNDNKKPDKNGFHRKEFTISCCSPDSEPAHIDHRNLFNALLRLDIEFTRQKFSIGHWHFCKFQKIPSLVNSDTISREEILKKHKSFSAHSVTPLPISKNIATTFILSYFPSTASSMVYDWPIWWGGGNLTRTSVWPKVRILSDLQIWESCLICK